MTSLRRNSGGWTGEQQLYNYLVKLRATDWGALQKSMEAKIGPDMAEVLQRYCDLAWPRNAGVEAAHTLKS
jgi:hypothetical protein